MQSVRYGQQRPGRRDRRLDAERPDWRLHLCEGSQVRRPRVRRGTSAVSGRADRAERTGPIPARHVGRGDRARRHAHARCTRALGRRGDPPVLLRRIERPPDAGHARRDPVSQVRHITARAHGMRGTHGRRGAGTLRKDAVGHLRGLSGRAPHHSVGRQPLDIGHPPRPLRARGSEVRRASHRDRPAVDAAGAPGRSPSRAAGPAPMWRLRSRFIAISSKNGLADTRFLAEHTKGADRLRERASAWTFERAAEISAVPEAALRRLAEDYASTSPARGAMRLGSRAQSQWRQRRHVDSRAAGGRRKIRSPRRRLFDEQLGGVEHHASVARRANRTRAWST